MRTAGYRIDHLFGVAVVGGDQCNAARVAYSFRNPTKASVHELASLDRFVEFSGVAHHVGVGEVDHEHVRLSLVDSTQHFVSNLKRRHLRLQIVSRDLRRWHEQAPFAFELLLDAAVKEVSDVRILLRLGEAVIVYLEVAPDFGQHVFMLARRKRDRKLERLVVHREANEFDVRPIVNRKLLEIRYCQSSRQLPRALRTEVEEDDTVVVLDRRDRTSITTNDLHR